MISPPHFAETQLFYKCQKPWYIHVMRTCHHCHAPFEPRLRNPIFCCRQCAHDGHNAFTMAARRHYAAYLKAQGQRAPGGSGHLQQVIAPTPTTRTLEITEAPSEAPRLSPLPIGWDHGLMRNWHGKVSPKTEQGPAVAITERRIKR